MKQIIAIGGGGFGRSMQRFIQPEQAAPLFPLEQYILAQTGKKHPNVCFLPQASSESKEYIIRFYETFTALGARPSWLSLFGTVQPGWQEHLLQQDVIYVGGGNTKSMLALWRTWEVDVVLRQAYEQGIVLAGVSAGAICWFEQCLTDSVWPLGVLPALGFLPGSCVPHYDTEKERRPAYHAYLRTNAIMPGIGVEDNAAAHFVEGTLTHVFAAEKEKTVFCVDQHGNEYPWRS